MNREQKSQLVRSLQSKLVDSALVVVIHYRGMSDKQLYDLRVALKSKGCNMKIAKNTLIKVALKKTEFELLSEHLFGPTAILYSQNPVALCKVVADVAKQVEVLKIKIGFFNQTLVTEEIIKEMAKLGSIEEVRASFLGLLSAKQSNFVRLLTAHKNGLADKESLQNSLS